MSTPEPHEGSAFSPLSEDVTPLVEARRLSKNFFGLQANDEVDFAVLPGEIHALVGENGAGKSTLCSMLAGAYRPDSGTLAVAGAPQRFRSPHDALSAGIGMVYQHYRLVDRFSVAENLFLAHPEIPFRVSHRELEHRAAAAMDRYDIRLDPVSRCGDLSVGEQQRVEILRLLVRGAQVLILDEPTAVLTPQESGHLFLWLSRLAREGRGIVFVSHKMNEVFAVSHRVTVLREGCTVGTYDAERLNPRQLAGLMVTESPDRLDGADSAAGSDPAGRRNAANDLRIEGLRVFDNRGREALRGLNLDVLGGEIVGLAGVSGNGQRELADAIAGVARVAEGSVSLGGLDITTVPVVERARRGIAYVPEDRLAVGVASGLSLEENLALRSSRQREAGFGPFLSRRRMRRRAMSMIKRFDIRGVRPGLPVRVLSGGNLQKVIVARELADSPRVVIAAAPTRGLDLASTSTVRGLLREQRNLGSAVLVISEDLDELREISDRLVVIYSGQVIGEMPADEADIEKLGLLMAGST